MTAVSVASVTPREPTSRGGYWLPVLVVVGALGFAVLYASMGVYTAWRAPDHFARTVVGGRLSVDVAAAGRVVIYHEGVSAAPAADLLGLVVTAPDGSAVAVEPYPGDLAYDRGSALATAVAAFNAPAPGSYQLSSEAARTGAWLAVGPDMGGIAGDGVMRAGLIVVVGVIAGIALAVRAATRHTSE